MPKSNLLRKLARQPSAQFMYNRSKELPGVRLFANTTDFTFIQTCYLQWLEIYSSLYEDIASGKKFINETILKDDMRVNAYLLYRSLKKDDNEPEPQDTPDTNAAPSIVFTNKGK